MTLAEIFRILQAQGEVVDIQGVSRDGPFTVTFSDGTTQEGVTLADLQAAVAELQAAEPPTGQGATRERINPGLISEPQLPSGPSNIEGQPFWWDPKEDGDWSALQWDSSRYGPFPYKTSVATDAEVAAGLAKEGEMMIDGADRTKAAAQKKAALAIEPVQPKELAEGQEPFISRSGYDWQWNPATGKYDIPIGKTEEEKKPTPLAADQLPSVSRGGYDYRWNPATGQYDIPVGATKEGDNRTFDEKLIDAMDAGDEDEVARILAVMDKVEALKNRPRPMNDQEIFAFLAPIAQNPQHFEELLRAFKQDMGTYVPQVTVGGAQDGTEGKVGIPSGNGQGVGPGSPQATIAAIQEEIRILGGQPQTPERDARLAELNEQLRIISVGPGIKAPAPTQEKSQAWLRSGSGHVIVDPNPDTSTPGRFYDTDNHTWEPMDAYNERMARFKAAQAQAQGGITTPPQLSMPGTRTQEEEDWLKWFLEAKEQAAARGVGVPPAAAERYAQVAGKAPFNLAQLAVPVATTNGAKQPVSQLSLPGQGTGQTTAVKTGAGVPRLTMPGVVKQGAAFGGTPFFPIPTGTSRGSVLQEKFAREYNEARQQEFRRRKPPQLSFR